MHPHVLSGLLQPVQILMFLTFATKWESTLLLDSSVQFSRADKHNAFSFLRSSSGCWLLSSDHSIPMLNPNHMVWIYIAFLQNIKRQLFLVREYFIHITLNTVLSLFYWTWQMQSFTYTVNVFVELNFWGLCWHDNVFDGYRYLYSVYDKHPYSSICFDWSLVGICFNNPHTHRLGPKLSLFKSILQLMYYVMSCYYN